MKTPSQNRVLTQRVPPPSEWLLEEPIIGVDYGRRAALVAAAVPWLSVAEDELSGASGASAAGIADELGKLTFELNAVGLRAEAKRARRAAEILREFARTDQPSDLATGCAALTALRMLLASR